jgi:hypothetical protein
LRTNGEYARLATVGGACKEPCLLHLVSRATCTQTVSLFLFFFTTINTHFHIYATFNISETPSRHRQSVRLLHLHHTETPLAPLSWRRTITPYLQR